MDELDHHKVLKKIIYKELEPCVLNDEIISNAIYDQGPIGEAGRLFRSMEIQYDKVTILRLEFMSEYNIILINMTFILNFNLFETDILRIDNLWILPNLRILSLAFNKIDKIENLDALTELQELNLTFNAIEKLENLNLKKLEVFNVFGNKIRFKFNLQSILNFETN
jgi:Leucine-rich repeat (LRR) protein